MKKINLKNIKFILIFAFFILLITAPNCFAGSQELENLEYVVEINSDGSMDVTEKWDLKVYDTNTVFKDFDYPENKFSNVRVLDTTNGQNQPLTQIYEAMYHVTPGCYYAMNYNGNFEIAWCVNSENTTKRLSYEISYTVTDVVQLYADCAEFYWQFVGQEETIPAYNIKGTISLPSTISNIEDLRIWAHGPLSGDIQKPNGNTVTFDLPNLRSDEYLEIRIVTPPQIYELISNRKSVNKLESIIAEETKWADEANAKREQAKKYMQMFKMFINIGSILISIFLFTRINKAREILKTRPEKQIQKLDYFRDFPDKTATPGEAEYMRMYNKSFNTQNAFSAIIMDLANKGCIKFEPIANEKKNVTIVITNKVIELKSDEDAIFKFICSASEDDRITMKEFRKYCERNSKETYYLYESIKSKSKDECKKRKCVDDELLKECTKYSIEHRLYIISLAALFGIDIVLFAFYPIVLLPFIMMIISAIYYGKLVNSYSGITVKGLEEREQWKGLKKYMEDFSLLKEKEIPDLVLWEKYLVYATAFGIADKVLKQLKVAYPQLMDDDYMRNNYASMYYMSHYNVGREFSNSMNRGYSSYVSSQASSGSGGGGGFSGGGGGGFGGGGSGGR